MYRRRDKWDQWDEEEDLGEGYGSQHHDWKRCPYYEEELRRQRQEGNEPWLGGKLKEWKDDLGETIGSAVSYAGQKMDDWSGRGEQYAKPRSEYRGRRWDDEEDDSWEKRRTTYGPGRRTGKGPDEWAEYTEEELQGRRTGYPSKKKTYRKDDDRANLQGIEDSIDQMKAKGGDVDILCVDSSRAAGDVLQHAIRNVPKAHTLLLLHGTYAPLGGLELDSKKDKKERKAAKKQLKRMCSQNGRKCLFKHFDYSSNSDMGEKVCKIAKRKDVSNVIIGRRGEVSDLRRTLMGSPSIAVMRHCEVPVTLVFTKATPTKDRSKGRMDLGNLQ